MFRPIQSRRSFEEALDQLVEAILTGELRVGDRIPAERELAAAMGISRPTLREAHKLLREAGVIEVRGRSGGAYVKSSDIPRELLAQRRKLLLDEVGSVLEARRILETSIARIAGMVATDDDLRALAETVELQRQVGNDHERLLLIDERFHLELARASHNPTLMEFMRTILRRMAVVRDMPRQLPEDAKLELEIHELTLRALESRDPAAIDAAMDEHMSDLEDIWEEETGRPVLRASATGVAASQGRGRS